MDPRSALTERVAVVDPATVALQHWRNGGGVTRELWSQPGLAASTGPGPGFLWRLSLADVTADGPFSRLPGVDRVSLAVAGPALHLRIGDARVGLRAGEPVRYDGGAPVVAERETAPGRPTQVLNLMTARGRCAGDLCVEALEGRADWPAGARAVVLVHGSLRVAGRPVPRLGAAVRVDHTTTGATLEANGAVVAAVHVSPTPTEGAEHP